MSLAIVKINITNYVHITNCRLLIFKVDLISYFAAKIQLQFSYKRLPWVAIV